MAEITDPNLLAQLNGGPEQTAPQQAPVQATPAPTAPAQGQSGGEVTDPAILAQLNEQGSQGPAQGQTQPQGQAAPWAKYFPNGQPSQDDVTNKIINMLNDPKVPTQDIRDLYTSLGAQINEHDDKVLQMRDTYLQSHQNKEAPTIGVDSEHPETSTGDPHLVDNRPYSFGRGFVNGAEHVGENLVKGTEWLSNHGALAPIIPGSGIIQTNLGDLVHDKYQQYSDSRPNQGSWLGKAAGETATTLPLLAVSGPIGTGAEAFGAAPAVATGLGLFGAGALQGAATTDSNTPGGVAKDALIGGTVNTVLGGAGKLAEGTLARGVAPTRAAQAGREVIDAADRLSRDGVKVPVTPAMTGGNLARGGQAIGEAGIFSNLPIAKANDSVVKSLETVRNRTADALAPQGQVARDINATADNVLNGKGGLGDYEEASADTIGKQYDKARDLAQGTAIPAPKTLAKLNQIIKARYAQPGGPGPGITALEALRDDLTPTPDVVKKPSLLARIFRGAKTTVTPGDPAEYAIQQLRDTRTNFGDNFDQNQRAVRQAAKQLWGPLSEDIQGGLRAAGKTDAADAYQAADNAWAQREKDLNEVVNPLLGNRSAEQLGGKLIQMSKNDSDGLDRALSLMSPDQAAHVRASIVKDLGRANPGGQNAVGDAFSPAVFARDWDGLKQATSPTFSSGATGQDLQDIARVSQGLKEGSLLRNHSGTGRVAEAWRMLGNIVSGSSALSTLGTSALGETVGGNLLASERVAKGLVNLGEKRPLTKATLRTITQAPKTNIAWDRLLSTKNDDDQGNQ